LGENGDRLLYGAEVGSHTQDTPPPVLHDLWQIMQSRPVDRYRTSRQNPLLTDLNHQHDAALAATALVTVASDERDYPQSKINERLKATLSSAK
jgi:hypothetical protein